MNLLLQDRGPGKGPAEFSERHARLGQGVRRKRTALDR